MKQIGLLAMALVFISTFSFGATIALKATWNPNTDSVTIGYKLYRTDGTRVLIGTIPGKTPTQPYLFNITVPDNSTGTATFVMTAYSATKESADSGVANYPFDLTPPPAIPSSFTIAPQP